MNSGELRQHAAKRANDYIEASGLFSKQEQAIIRWAYSYAYLEGYHDGLSKGQEIAVDVIRKAGASS